MVHMQLHRPFAALTPTVDGDVLAALALVDDDFTAPELHRVIGEHSVEGVRKVLQRLAEQGIVSSARRGNAVLYRLNREHLAAAAVIEISRLRAVFVTRMSAAIGAWERPPVAAVLFGSAATGRMQPNSDIDVFVVRPDGIDADDGVWGSQRRALERSIAACTGNDARILEYALSEASSPTPDPVLDDIRHEGVVLFGTLPGATGDRHARR